MSLVDKYLIINIILKILGSKSQKRRINISLCISYLPASAAMG